MLKRVACAQSRRPVGLALVVDGLEGSEHPSSIGNLLAVRASRSMLRSHVAIAIGGHCDGTDLFGGGFRHRVTGPPFSVGIRHRSKRAPPSSPCS